MMIRNLIEDAPAQNDKIVLATFTAGLCLFFLFLFMKSIKSSV